MYYVHRHTTEADYQVIHYFPSFPSGNIGEEVVAPDNLAYLVWVAAGGTPIVKANGRFLSVVDNQLVVDPNKDSILAAETAAAQAEATRLAAKAQAIIDNIPSWSAVEAAINAADTVAKLRSVVLKIARVLYWNVKNTSD
jgi:hypothetical protein